MGASAPALPATPAPDLFDDDAPTSPRRAAIDDFDAPAWSAPEFTSPEAPAAAPVFAPEMPAEDALSEGRSRSMAQFAVDKAIAEGLLGGEDLRPFSLSGTFDAPAVDASGQQPAQLEQPAATTAAGPAAGDYALVDLVAGILDPGTPPHIAGPAAGHGPASPGVEAHPPGDSAEGPVGGGAAGSPPADVSSLLGEQIDPTPPAADAGGASRTTATAAPEEAQGGRSLSLDGLGLDIDAPLVLDGLGLDQDLPPSGEGPPPPHAPEQVDEPLETSKPLDEPPALPEQDDDATAALPEQDGNPPETPNQLDEPSAPPEEVAEPPAPPEEVAEPPAPPEEVAEPPEEVVEEAGEVAESPAPPEELAEPPVHPEGVAEPPAPPEEVAGPPAPPEEVAAPPALPEEVAAPPAPPEEVAEPPALPEEVAEPPALPEKVAEPPALPEEATQPPALPEEATQPPALPEEVTEPPALPEEADEPPALPEEADEPPTLPAQVAELSAPSDRDDKPAQAPEQLDESVGPTDRGGSPAGLPDGGGSDASKTADAELAAATADATSAAASAPAASAQGPAGWSSRPAVESLFAATVLDAAAAERAAQHADAPDADDLEATQESSSLSPGPPAGAWPSEASQPAADVGPAIVHEHPTDRAQRRDASSRAEPPAVLSAGRWDTGTPAASVGAGAARPSQRSAPAIVAHGPSPPSAPAYDPHEEQPTQLIYAPRASSGAGPAVIPGGPLALPPPSAQVAGAQTVVLDRSLRPASAGALPAAAAAGPASVADLPSASLGAAPAATPSAPPALTPPPPPVPGVSDDPLVGEMVDGKYRVLRRIGVGGMGAVYLAEQVDMRRRVALKVLTGSHGGVERAEHERRFLREAQAASKLNHPNIVTVYTFGRLPDRTLFLAMEYIEGVPLADVMKQEGSLALNRALDIAIQVCAGLAEAHSHGVVHRDLKPDNIILARRRGGEVAKILDFGIAKILDPNESPADITRVGLVRGTPIYMSPEQARGDRIDRRSDIYSLGVILHFLLTGQHPVQADTPFGYLHAHQHQKPPGIRTVRPELSFPIGLEGLVLRCLEKRPERRPPTVADLEDGLKLLRAELLGVTPDPAWRALPPAMRPRSHGRWILPVVAVVMLALMATLLVRVLSGDEDDGGPAKRGPAQGGAATADAEAVGAQPPRPPEQVAPRRVEASAPERPAWADEAPIQVGDERVAIGTSGPTATRREATRWARAAAWDALAHLLLEDLGQADLLLTLRGLAGDRRGVLFSGFDRLSEQVMLKGTADIDEALLSELRAGQQDAATRFEGLLKGLGLRQGLPAADVYWERYREGPPGGGDEFFRAWARRSLPAGPVRRVRKGATTARELVGVAVVDPYPTITWGLRDPRGALVYAVKDGEPGSRAGLLPGDLIVAAANRPIGGREDLNKLLPPLVASARRSGQPVSLSVRRAGEGRFDVQLRLPRPRRPKPRPASSTSGGSIDE